MTMNRVFTAAVGVVAVLAAVSAGAQAQGGQQQSGMRDSLFGTLSDLVRQYQGGQESQAQSGMRDLLGSLARGISPPQQPGQPGQQGQQQDMNALLENVANDVARRYGGEDMNALVGGVLGDTFSQFDQNSEYYQNLTDLTTGWYQPPPQPNQTWPSRQANQTWPPTRPNPQPIARCTIFNAMVILTDTGAVISQQLGGPVGQLIQPTNPRCRYMIRDYGGGELCVAPSGYVWSPTNQQPVGQCQ